MPAYAASYGFDDISSNGDYNEIIGDYLSVEMSETDNADEVLFTIKNSELNNTGGIIMDVYFSSNPEYFGGIVSIINTDTDTDTVSFSEVTRGSINLPDDDELTTTWGLSVDPDTPQPVENGVAAGESLGVILSLSAGYDFDDILNAMGNTFLIGLHMQSFLDDSSESLVSVPSGGGGNTGGFETPIPAAIWLFGSALIGLMGVSRKQKTMVA